MRLWILPAAALIALLASAIQGAEATPSLNKSRLETYLRYAEGYPPQVTFQIDDPKPSPFPGLYEVAVHLAAGPRKADMLYYLTQDGKQLISGNVYDLNGNPFRANLSKLDASGPSFGPADAPVTIVVFSDFECPYCRQEAKVIRDNLPKAYPTQVRVVYKNFPLESIHPWAKTGAAAGACVVAQKQAAFWPFHDWIYEHQQDINPGNAETKILDYSQQQGLNREELGRCLHAPETAHLVERTELEGRALQITQTPTEFVNGRKLQGALDWPTLDAVIKLELSRPREVAQIKNDKCCEVRVPRAGEH